MVSAYRELTVLFLNLADKRYVFLVLTLYFLVPLILLLILTVLFNNCLSKCVTVNTEHIWLVFEILIFTESTQRGKLGAPSRLVLVSVAYYDSPPQVSLQYVDRFSKSTTQRP